MPIGSHNLRAILIVLYMMINTHTSVGIPAANQTTSTSDDSTLQETNSRITRLGRSASRWSVAYLIVTGLAIAVAMTALYAQFKALGFTRNLNAAQSEREVIKDRQAEAKIAELNRSAAESNRLAVEATARATEAQSHLADANARISEANARVKEAEARVASADTASKEAVAKVASAEARIAEANRAAANANATAERERLARKQLEARFAWRELDQVQQQGIGKRLAQFAGTQYELVTYPDNPESLSLVAQIDGILSSAHWTRVPTTAFIAFSLEYGVRITFNPLDTQAGQALAEELTKHGIQQITTGTRGVRGIEIMIGRNPQSLLH